MKKFKHLLIVASLYVISSLSISCNNGGGECTCDETTGIGTQVAQGDADYCDERRATGECKHTRACDEKKKKQSQN